MRARTLSFIVLAVAFIINNAATKFQAPEPQLFIDRAADFFNRAGFDSAIANYRKAEVALRDIQNWKALAACRTSIAEVYRVMNNTQVSTAWLDSAYSIIQQHNLNNTEELAKALEINGRVLDYNLRQFDNAEVLYDSSLTIRRNLFGNEHMGISEDIYLIGRTYFFRGRLEDAEKNFQEAVDMKIKLAGNNEMSLFDPYQSLGALNRRLLRLDRSLYYYKKAEAIWENNHRPKDHPSYGMMVYGLGNLNIETGMYEDAKQNYRDAAKTFVKYFGEKDFRTASAYANIGACYRNQLEYAEAEQYYSMGKAIYEEVLPEDHPFIVTSYIDMADMHHAFGNEEESAKFSALAIGLMEKYQPKDNNRDLALACLYYAATLAELNRLDEAKQRVETAIAILTQMDELYLTSQAWTLSGKIRHLMNDDAIADQHYRQAIELFGKDPTRTRQLGYNLGAYGKFKNELGDPKEALAMFDKAMYQLNTSIGEKGVINAANDYQNLDFLIEVLPGRGEALMSLERFEEAYNNYVFLTGLYEHIVKDSRSERSKLLQIPNMASFYEKAVSCAFELWADTRDDVWRDRAFALSEQSKSIILLQYIHDTRSREFAGIPSQVTSEERRFKEKLRHIEKSIGDTGDEDTTVVKLKEAYFRLRASYDSLVKKIETDFPAYYALKYKNPETDIAKLQALLDPGEAILEYLVGDRDVYFFLITKNDVIASGTENEGTLDTIATNIRSSMLSMDQEKFAINSRAFFDNFFYSADQALRSANIHSVTIIPDGSISYIPFEGLLDNDNKYLIHNYTFHYQYSAGLMSTYADVAHGNSNADFIGFAPTFDGSNQLASLDFTTKEVDAINDLLGGKSYTGDAATESNFKKLVGEYGIVHVATHAVMDDKDADHSRLHFAAADSLDDGRLHAWELFGMNIPASLVTLSACNTGDGRLHKGEGVMSLSRAFAYAGCPSIVTSLWQAQDQSTAMLMRSFYEFLSDGMNKAEALRQAKLKYLAEADKVKSMPFFWAGFVLVGDDQPLPKSYAMWWMAAIIGVVVVAAGMLFRSSRVQA